ncbi:aldo-keto reductase-like protein [Periconia macrospinosa]|uniref:Aldo-keto reductase-like protein n=1 Tax=Periconia macrospinosa TaxID=97972 RepID=A0A2V1E4P7_9PLEO|nr:aldo-keto reductase-like protein [Periconia macrospinosa]
MYFQEGLTLEFVHLEGLSMKYSGIAIARFSHSVTVRISRIPAYCIRTSPAHSSNRSMSSSATSRLLTADSDDWKPAFIYGTAWKKERTAELVKLAIQSGFREVDTAAQPRHYQEHLVGDALRDVYAESLVTREKMYLQTKYTTPAGQDPKNMPYDASAPLEDQIRTSVASSLKNLRPAQDSEEDSYIDCLLLHSPLQTVEQTLQAWAILESYVPKKIRSLGISNVSLPVLKAIHENSSIKPAVVQNRFYPQTRYDAPLRAFCGQHHISYQSFWTLTGNPHLLQSDPVSQLSHAVQVSRSVALYALVMDQGIVVLNGTTSAAHMEEDVSGIRKVRDWAQGHEKDWDGISRGFSNIIQSTHF